MSALSKHETGTIKLGGDGPIPCLLQLTRNHLENDDFRNALVTLGEVEDKLGLKPADAWVSPKWRIGPVWSHVDPDKNKQAFDDTVLLIVRVAPLEYVKGAVRFTTDLNIADAQSQEHRNSLCDQVHPSSVGFGFSFEGEDSSSLLQAAIDNPDASVLWWLMDHRCGINLSSGAFEQFRDQLVGKGDKYPGLLSIADDQWAVPGSNNTHAIDILLQMLKTGNRNGIIAQAPYVRITHGPLFSFRERILRAAVGSPCIDALEIIWRHHGDSLEYISSYVLSQVIPRGSPEQTVSLGSLLPPDCVWRALGSWSLPKQDGAEPSTHIERAVRGLLKMALSKLDPAILAQEQDHYDYKSCSLMVEAFEVLLKNSFLGACDDMLGHPIGRKVMLSCEFFTGYDIGKDSGCGLPDDGMKHHTNLDTVIYDVFFRLCEEEPGIEYDRNPTFQLVVLRNLMRLRMRNVFRISSCIVRSVIASAIDALAVSRSDQDQYILLKELLALDHEMVQSHDTEQCGARNERGEYTVSLDGLNLATGYRDTATANLHDPLGIELDVIDTYSLSSSLWSDQARVAPRVVHIWDAIPQDKAHILHPDNRRKYLKWVFHREQDAFSEEYEREHPCDESSVETSRFGTRIDISIEAAKKVTDALATEMKRAYRGLMNSKHRTAFNLGSLCHSLMKNGRVMSSSHCSEHGKRKRVHCTSGSQVCSVNQQRPALCRDVLENVFDFQGVSRSMKDLLFQNAQSRYAVESKRLGQPPPKCQKTL